MKIGILNAFPPEERIIHWEAGPVPVYVDFIEQAHPAFTYVGYEVAQGHFPDSPGECDAYVITGSPRGAYDADGWVVRLIEFIREAYQARVKLVGICFGHQILAHALGGESKKSDKGWGLGLKPFEIGVVQPWMDGRSESCSLYFAHQDQVVQLPPEAEWLGGNDFCPNALFVIGGQVLGIQGHPEFTAGMMRDIMTALEGVLSPQRIERAVSSMKDQGPDNERVARWVVNFLHGDGAGI